MINLTKNIFSAKKKYKKLIGTYYSPFKQKNFLEDIDALIIKNNLQFVEHNVEQEKKRSIKIKFNI